MGAKNVVGGANQHLVDKPERETAYSVLPWGGKRRDLLQSKHPPACNAEGVKNINTGLKMKSKSGGARWEDT